MLDKNNSILWEEYRANKHNYENETLNNVTLGLIMCFTIDKFNELHVDFNGKEELYAIRGMANPQYEKYQSYADAFNNDILAAMKSVRPKLKELLKINSVDPTALILYAMTGMFLDISPEESNELHHILLTLLQYETIGIDVTDCKEMWGHFAYTLDFESNYDSSQMDGKEIAPISF